MSAGDPISTPLPPRTPEGERAKEPTTGTKKCPNQHCVNGYIYNFSKNPPEQSWVGCAICSPHHDAAAAPSETPEPPRKTLTIAEACEVAQESLRHNEKVRSDAADREAAPLPERTATEPSYGIVEVLGDMNDEIEKMTANTERKAGLSTITYWRDLLATDLANALTERSANTKLIVADLEAAKHVARETLNLRVQSAPSSPSAAPTREIDLEEIKRAIYDYSSAAYRAGKHQEGFATSDEARPLLALIRKEVERERARAEAFWKTVERQDIDINRLRSENGRMKSAITEAIALLENGTDYEKLHVTATLRGSLSEIPAGDAK